MQIAFNQMKLKIFKLINLTYALVVTNVVTNEVKNGSKI